MATKKELIGKLNQACARVLKQSDFAGLGRMERRGWCLRPLS
jgi:hypothetical protein